MRIQRILACVVLLLLAWTPLSAQTEKGRSITDIDFSLDIGTTEFDDSGLEVDHNNLKADIHVGYTVIDDLDVGVFLGVSHETIEIGSLMEQSQKSRFYGVFGRYFFLEGQGLRPFIGASGGLGTMQTTATGTEDTEHGLLFGAGTAGAAYFFNAHFGMELAAEYVVTSFSEDDGNATSEDMSATSFQISLGTVVSF